MTENPILAELALEGETFRYLTGFPNYAFSSRGRVLRTTRSEKGHLPRALGGTVNNKGYKTITLWVGKRWVRRLVHRLVCEAFNGPPPAPGLDCAHFDGNPLNNTPDNLRWATRSENMEDARRHGTMALGATHGSTTKPERTPRGERHGHAKLTEGEVLEIRNSKAKGRSLAAAYGVSPALVCIIRRGKVWKHLMPEGPRHD